MDTSFVLSAYQTLGWPGLLALATVALASVLTNVIPTPGSDAPIWKQVGYRILELCAFVGNETKRNPAAEQAALEAAAAAEKGDTAGALSGALATYEALRGSRKTTGPAVGCLLAMFLAAAGALTACSSQTLTKALTVACAVDAMAQPVLVPLAADLVPGLAEAASVDEALVHPAVVAACAGVGGKPVGVK